MRHLARITLSLFIILSPALCRAENDTITHDFNALNGTRLTYNGDYTAGLIDGNVFYNCVGNAKFGTEAVNKTSTIAVNLKSSTDSVKTAVPISNLKKIRLWHYPVSQCTNIKIQLSTDGSTWGSALTGITYAGGYLYVEFSEGDYYVKIYNTTSDVVAILKTQFISTKDECNCFIYKP